MSKLKAVLFDHDGTLIDSERLHYQMWRDVLSGYRINLAIDDYNAHYAGIPALSGASKMIDRHAGLSVTAAVLAGAKDSAVESYLRSGSFPLMDGAMEVLDFFCEMKLKIAIVTGAAAAGVDTTLRVYNLQNHISAVVSGDDVENSKPAADVYRLTMRKLGVDASECIAIEDTETGVAAAVDAGIPCIALSSPISRRHDFSRAIKKVSHLNDARIWIADNFLFESNAGWIRQ